MKANELVKKAQENVNEWQSDNIHDEQVIFGNNVFTVGSNGDAQDFDTADKAAEALEWCWKEEDEAD